jgi:TRAP-type mannitol/chloroaromatic compound transport system permease small subunit
MENANRCRIDSCYGVHEEKEEPWIEMVNTIFIITIFLLLLATIAGFVKIRMGG